MSDRNERLSAILRKGDPAAGDPGLPPEELQAMRRAMLSAIPEPRRRGWLVPVLAAMAVLALAAVLVSVQWRPERFETARRPSPPSPTSPPPSPGEGGTLSARRTGNSEGRTLESLGRAGAPLSQRGGRGGGRGDGGEGRPEPEVVVAQVEPRPVSHQIQFSTPGGTRVIWVPNPTAE